MPFLTSSDDTLSLFSQTALIRVLASPPWIQSHCKSAHVLVSSRIYWQVESEDGTNKPTALSDYRNANSLELVRLNDDEPWHKVDEIVKVGNYEGRTCITIRGRLHGHSRRKDLFLVRDAEIQIIPNTPQQQEVWMNKIRARIVPWNLLEQDMRDASGVEELEIALGGLATTMVDNKSSSMPTEEVEEKWPDNLGTLPDQMQKLSIVDELIAHGTAAIETGATLTKLVTVVERVAETAEFVADVSKCVAGVSTIFHLVALSAHAVSMCAEANRGQRVLPVALCRIVILLRYVLESMTEIMKPSRIVNELDKDSVFRALRETLCTMDLAETQLLRGRGGQIVNAGVVKEVQRKIEELEPLVQTVSNTSRICALSEEVNRLREGQEIWDDGPHHVRPSVSSFFSGRGKELKTLRDKLDKWGSVVITQYGGLGKTQLMTAFADRAEREELVPGGVFWVTADGGARDVINSLVRLWERLTRRKMSDEDRRNDSFVITELKRGLDERQGRWLLCLDNADNSKVSGILNELCGEKGHSRRDGWILITSRQGRPLVWNGMKSEQKLALEPLCTEDAMVVLWRHSKKKETIKEDDDKVMAEIRAFESDNEIEYSALKKLCGDDDSHGLGGLPLALVQAGSYIAQFKDKFADYLNLIENENREDWQDIMQETEELKPVRESQRSIWTTWKISVRKLSKKACTVLQTMSMLGKRGIGEEMLKKILKASAADEGGVEVKFRTVIVKELMHGSSLVWCEEGKGEEVRMYKMHGLVRVFVLSEIVRGSSLWNHLYSLALPAVHETVRTELENKGNSFYELPDVFGNNHCEIAEHSLALVRHHMLPEVGMQIPHEFAVHDLHWYTGKVMGFLGNSNEEVLVWTLYLEILCRRQEQNRKNRIRHWRDTCFRRNRGKEIKARIAIVNNSLGCAFLTMGKFDEAASKLEESLEMKRAIYGNRKPHSHIVSSLNNLGLVYREMGELGKALEKNTKSLEVSRVIYGNSKPHIAIARSLNNLGTVYLRMNQLDLALQNHEESLKMKQQIHGRSSPHPDIASSFNNLGLVYGRMRNPKKALENHERSLQISRTIHGLNRPHPDIASSLNNIALVHQEQGELEKALEKNEECLAMYRAIYGNSNSNPDVAMAHNNLGTVYNAMGNLDKARENHERSVEIYEATLKECKQHPDIASPLDNLGIVYRKMGDLTKALASHERSLKIYQAIHGLRNAHPKIASCLNNIGLVYEEMGNLDEALVMYEKSLEMYRVIHGHHGQHLDIALSLNNLGVLHQKMGDLSKALSNHEQSLEMQRVIHGPEVPHTDVAASLCNIGNVYKDMGQLDEALVIHNQALEMLKVIHGHGEEHSDIASSLNNLGILYMKMGQLEKALEKHKQSLEMRQAIHGMSKSHSDIASSLYNLGCVFFRKGELEQARRMHQQGLEMQRAIHGRDNPHLDVGSSLQSLGQVHQGMGNLKEALECHKQSLEIYRSVHSTTKPHIDIASSLHNLGMVYQAMGKEEETVYNHEQSIEMYHAIYGESKPHLDIASSLLSLGFVHHAKKEFQKALEKFEQNLEMRRAIHGKGKAHPDIACSLNCVGVVYQKMDKMAEAQEKLEDSLKMRRTIYGHSEPHLDVALSLDSLGFFFLAQGELQKALEKYEQSLQMKQAIHGEDNPHSETATALCNVGLVHQMQKNLNQAANYQEQSLKMLQILHGPNSELPQIKGLQSCLADVYQDQGRQDEALAMRENVNDAGDGSDGAVPNRAIGTKEDAV